ncbi:MAG: hydantoinase/carbamoylase family amidase [Hyphomicrobiaceae bacterium]
MPEINAERVLADLRALKALAPYESGVHRPTLSPEHVASLRWLAAELKAIGHETMIDGIANVFGLSKAQGPRVLGGSHLESQNHAGWLDGPLGVVYALEAARVIHADPAFADCGVDVIACCDEEGHFGNFLGSRSAVGELDEAAIDAAVDRTRGTPMREALAAAGLAGAPRHVIDPRRYVGFLEAHIEQGDWLEANDLRIGVVTRIVGIRQYLITTEGVQNHAGTTRMAIRKDAGVAAARIAVAISDRFPEIAGERTVWTMGRITFDPGAPSVIPGRAELILQMRDPENAVLDRLEAAAAAIVAEADKHGPCRARLVQTRRTEPAAMAPHVMDAVRAAAEARAPGRHVDMPSGAGHDAMVFAHHMPSGMLFVPSIGGISHHWKENTSDADIVTGARVYVDAVARLLKATP